jgi:hypothetical protein
LDDLKKSTFYVRINGNHHDGNGITHYPFLGIQSAGNHCAKNLPQFACKTDGGAIAAHCLPHPCKTLCALSVLGDHQKTKTDRD